MTTHAEYQNECSKIFKALPHSAFKILIAIGIMGGVNIGNKQISKRTGISLPTVKTAVEDHLMLWKIVTHTHRENGWQLTDLGKDTIAFFYLASQKVLDSAPINNKDIYTDKDFEEIVSNINTAPTPKVFDSTSAPIEPEETLLDKFPVEKYHPGFSEKHIQEPDLAVQQILADAGIGVNMRTELSSVTWITEEYATAFKVHALAGKDNGGLDVALAIHMMRKMQDAPPINNNQHIIDCECHECKIMKYKEEGFEVCGIYCTCDDCRDDHPDDCKCDLCEIDRKVNS